MRIAGILIFIMAILSCHSSLPKNVLPPKKMQAVLWDVMQADEMADYYSAKDSSFRGLAKHAAYYQNIFSIHKISKDDFTKSLAYYEEHPAALKTILDSLQNLGEQLQKRDSLTKPDRSRSVDTIRKPPFRIQHH